MTTNALSSPIQLHPPTNFCSVRLGVVRFCTDIKESDLLLHVQPTRDERQFLERAVRMGGDLLYHPDALHMVATMLCSTEDVNSIGTIKSLIRIAMNDLEVEVRLLCDLDNDEFGSSQRIYPTAEDQTLARVLFINYRVGLSEWSRKALTGQNLVSIEGRTSLPHRAGQEASRTHYENLSIYFAIGFMHEYTHLLRRLVSPREEVSARPFTLAGLRPC